MRRRGADSHKRRVFCAVNLMTESVICFLEFIMQVLRYITFIWEGYEKGQEKTDVALYSIKSLERDYKYYYYIIEGKV